MKHLIDRANFSLVCLYLVSQAYTIPLLAVSSWPVWPLLADIASWAMIVSFVLHLRLEKQVSLENRKVWNLAVFLFVCCVLAVAGDLILPAKALRSDPGHYLSIALYQLYRFVEFLVVFHIAANLRLNDKRYRCLQVVSWATFLAIACGVFLTSFGVLSTSNVSRQLPNSLLEAGPWAFYSGGNVDQGVGFVGYNHAYTAIQLILAAGLALHFGPMSNKLRTLTYALLLASTFLSRSRAGFLCALLFVLFYEGRKHLSSANLILVVLFAFVALFGALHLFQNQEEDDSILGRQLSAESSYKENGLSGRTSIWSNTVEVLNAEPWRWITGNGFGSALDSGGDAHMLFLNITLETGIAGLLLFVVAFARLLLFLGARGDSGRAMFWTTLVLLVSSLTQETFYPVIAFGHFLGFYFLAIALSLNRFMPTREYAAANTIYADLLTKHSASPPRRRSGATSNRVVEQ
jgi:hypothetical protein